MTSSAAIGTRGRVTPPVAGRAPVGGFPVVVIAPPPPPPPVPVVPDATGAVLVATVELGVASVELGVASGVLTVASGGVVVASVVVVVAPGTGFTGASPHKVDPVLKIWTFALGATVGTAVQIVPPGGNADTFTVAVIDAVAPLCGAAHVHAIERPSPPTVHDPPSPLSDTPLSVPTKSLPEMNRPTV
jgi:hypothetical protein